MPQSGPQSEAIRKHWVDELFYGGAVGGGKSDFLLGDFAQDVPQEWGPYCRGILFRQTYPELEELIGRALEIYPPWFPGCEWKDSTKTWHWPNGATLKLRYLESESDWRRYWGHQYTWIGWDELPNWVSLNPYKKLKARLRSAHPVPNKRIRATGNPGGPSHHAVKEYFGIDLHPHGGQLMRDEFSGTRMFIRSRLDDNRILLANDPSYRDRLRALGSPELVRAWLEGDWSVIQGAFFPEFTPDRHVIRPRELPDHWTRFRAMDWGSARPFSVGWYAVSDGELEGIPRGCLVKYREWYGTTGNNTGLKLTAEQVGEGIKAKSGVEKYAYSVLDPAAFASDGGPSIAERMYRAGVKFDRADNKRTGHQGAMGGWDQLRARLAGDEAGPMLLFFDTCVHTIRTIPALQHDENKPEDVDTEAEDHAGDETRYACMSRPWVKQVKKPEPIKLPQEYTMNDWIKAAESTGPVRRGTR